MRAHECHVGVWQTESTCWSRTLKDGLIVLAIMSVQSSQLKTFRVSHNLSGDREHHTLTGDGTSKTSRGVVGFRCAQSQLGPVCLSRLVSVEPSPRRGGAAPARPARPGEAAGPQTPGAEPPGTADSTAQANRCVFVNMGHFFQDRGHFQRCGFLLDNQ